MEAREGFFGGYAVPTAQQRLLQRGPESLDNAELLEVVIGVNNESAHGMLNALDGLRGVLNSERSQFCAAKGVSGAKYARALAVREVCTRYMRERVERQALTVSEPASVKEYLTARVRDLDHEVFIVLFLDNRHRLIADEEMFRGTIDGASVYPREVVKRSLQLNAAAVIFAHNHPSGVAEPSTADRNLTKRLREALGTVDIRCLDHFVVGDGVVTSFAERSWV